MVVEYFVFMLILWQHRPVALLFHRILSSRQLKHPFSGALKRVKVQKLYLAAHNNAAHSFVLVLDLDVTRHGYIPLSVCVIFSQRRAT